MYKDGNNIVEANAKMHAYYAELGMLQESPNCTYDMAMCYMEGVGVSQSTSTATMLLQKAGEELGHAEALRIVKLLKSL